MTCRRHVPRFGLLLRLPWDTVQAKWHARTIDCGIVIEFFTGNELVTPTMTATSRLLSFISYKDGSAFTRTP